MTKETNIKPGYKKTPVGIIPEDWEVKKFEDCFEQLKTYTFSRNQLTYEEDENCIYNIHYGDIHATFPKNILDVEKDLVLIPKIIDPQIEEPVLLKDGDLIMADASEDYEGVGQSIELINIDDKKIVSGTHTFALREKQKFAPKYKGFIFSDFNTHKELKKIATGISVFGLSKSNISKIKLPIPPLPEQKAIADCLSTWDHAIEKQTQLIEAKKEFKKGLMQGFFNGQLSVAMPEALEGGATIIKAKEGEDFTEDWEEVRLGEIAKVYQPKTISQSDLTDAGYKVYGANGIIGYYSQFNHKESQIAVVCRGSTCGLVNLTEPKSWITGNAMVVNVDDNEDVDKLFLYSYLDLDNLFYLITGSGQPQITSDLKGHKIKLPEKKLQTTIAQVLQSADQEIELLEKKLEQLQLQKKGLMQVLLTGEKRLV